MRKGFLNFKKLSCILVVGVILMTGLTVYGVLNDTSGLRQQMAVESLKTNASVFGKYVDDVLNNRMETLENLASCMSMMDISNNTEVRDLVVSQNALYRDITVMDNYGTVLYGNDYKKNVLREEPFYQDLKEGKNVIADEITLDKEGQEVIRLFAPVVKDNRTRMVIMGTLPVNELSMAFDYAGYAKEGCICVINSDGTYFFGSRNFSSLLRDKESSHFTYLNNAKISGEQMTVSKIQENIRRRQEISLTYRYDKEKYIAEYSPLGHNDWYLVSMLPEKSIQTEIQVVSAHTRTAGGILFAMLCLLLSEFVYLLISNSRLKKENRRYKVLEGCDRTVTFEMTFQPKSLEFYGDMKYITGLDQRRLQGEAVYDIYDWVHEDDSSVRGRLHRFFDSGAEHFSTEMRIRNAKGEYGWYRLTGVLLKDPYYGENEKFIGKITNVDQQMTEEKDLMQRAENDLLTGVLNKKTMESKVSELLKRPDNKNVIFFMVDLDNFKNVNDTLGHIYGDKAIAETAQCLNKIFPERSYIGRLGGDEFAVCVTYDAFDEQSLNAYIVKKAEKICEINRRSYSNGEARVEISSSVGIAVAPDMGNDFDVLYQKADSALYLSKKSGKDCYSIYQS